MTHVLIVDDDRDHAESLADVLEIGGYAAALAFSGEEAIERFRGTDFDFVLLDVKLPGLNGIETFLELKKIRPSARVMVMTGYSVEQLVAQAIEGGAIGALNKPFSAETLLQKLSHVRPRGTVLVADDDPDFIAGVVPILEARHYVVDVATTGAEALDKILKGTVDCLLLDLHLPVLSGAELYARLLEAGRTVPTVIVTGGRELAEGDERLKAHSSGMLFKPFDPNELLAAIGSAVALGNLA